MTNEQTKAKELAELLTAFADGKQLEYHDEDYFEWFGTTSLTYVADSIIDNTRQIRIKPATKRIALNKQDLIDRLKLGFEAMWIKNINSGVLYQIISIHIVDVRVSEFRISYDVLSTDYTFLDNSTCYKEVECE